MCGIVGYIDTGRRIDRDLFRAMRDTLHHRGPDHAGEWFDESGKVAFGHRRLAIIDLSPSGQQPMITQDGRYRITFNGEIYNFKALRAKLEALGERFHTQSDTEVLLAAYAVWGAECVGRLEGMFAFAIFDALESKLFIARDRTGEKPLFYRQDTGRFIFASELKALLRHPDLPRKASGRGLMEYLAYGYVPQGECILEGYNKLPPAHHLTYWIDTGRCDVQRYWSLPDYCPGGGDDEALLDRLEILLQESVASQMVADVPVGILLSGGVDSSLVAAAAAQATSRPIKTFTISFPDSAAHDESVYAKQVADYLGADHTDLPADAQTINFLPGLVAQFDEPIADSSMVPTYMVSHLIRQHCTVALGGDGGDELFGGYLHYPWLLRFERWRKLGIPSQQIESLIGRILPIGTPGRTAALAMVSQYPGEVTLTRLLDPTSRRRLWAARVQDSFLNLPETSRQALVEGLDDPLEQICRLDFQVYMTDDILVKVDRASMLASLEVRAPFLNSRLVEFAFRDVPSSLKATTDARKILLRRLSGRLLPPAFDSSRKQGFSIPIGQWLRTDWAPLVQDLLEGGSPLFDPSQMRRLLGQLQVNDRGASRIFQLAMLEAWRRHYNITL